MPQQIVSMDKLICIHGHFYQPPRENPWLEAVELQDSAAPWHDWNERVSLECYAPNAAARILNGDGKIENIISNYSRISFNFGPTLLAWLLDKMPALHQAIVSADQLSRERYGGHGSALAQIYNHVIMPLTNERDKVTEVRWAIRDFQSRFGRKPEGLWLSETAADTATFEVLAQQGILFTVLSPYQARAMRRIGDPDWQDVNGGRIDPTRPYLINLPSGRHISVFFYDAFVSQAVAFEQLLSSGDRLANRLLGAFSNEAIDDQLVHIATDGESYGHHHRHGEMALAYALEHLETSQVATLTNYGEYMEKHPPQFEAQIHEGSAWSCPHGVGRWKEDCGCNSGGHGDWNQRWRAPLRQALDWLRDEMAPRFEARTAELLRDPWQARNDYIAVILDRSPESRERFFTAHARQPLSEEDKTTVLKLMELQRHALLMYTSCGWFFDELSGIETVQVIQYAARVIQLANELFGQDFEPAFLDRLELAKSNIPEHGDGRAIYHKFVKPAMIDWHKAVAHYAISSIFHAYSQTARVFSFSFEEEHRELFTSGKTRLAIGRTRVTSEITEESALMSYAILYLGEHNLAGGVRTFQSVEAYDTMFHAVKEAYEAVDFPQVIRLIDHHLGETCYSLKSLFKDEQRQVLNEILASAREDLEQRFRLITERYAPLMKFLQGAGAPLPPGLQTAWDLSLHSTIRKQLDNGNLNVEQLRNAINEAQLRGTEVLNPEISYSAKSRMERAIGYIAQNPCDLDRVRELEQIASLVMPLPLGLNLAEVQNTYWSMRRKVLPELHERAQSGDPEAAACLKELLQLGERLGFSTTALQP